MGSKVYRVLLALHVLITANVYARVIPCQSSVALVMLYSGSRLRNLPWCLDMLARDASTPFEVHGLAVAKT